jgi:hypothetical protein
MKERERVVRKRDRKKAGGGDMLTIFWCLINGGEREEADGCM